MSLDYERIAKVLGGTLHDMGEAPPFGFACATPGPGAALASPTACMLQLPYPPSVNRMWRNVNGRTILSRAGRHYRGLVAAVCVGVRPIDGDVSVRMKIYRPRKIGDIDNAFKGVFDALRGIAFHDDKQVVRIEADRLDDKANPRIEILVSAVGAADGGRP